MEYLGYILTRDGIKPQPSKVQAMLELALPRYVKNSADSWGWFNIIETSGQAAATCLPLSPHWLESVVRLKPPRPREPKRSHGTGPKSIKKAFDDVKATIAKEVVLAYPDFDKVFEIYTDASTKQLGSVITQSNRPLAFFSRKLSVQQQKYSVTKIKLLAIVETLKEFKGMLWGQCIKVYTDHKNFT